MSLYDETSSVLCRKSSVIFGYLRQSLENVHESSSGLRINFEKSSEIFVKWSKIFGKSSKTSSFVCLCNKQNITCPLVDTNFISSCSIRSFFCAKWRELFLYLYSFRALFGRYSLPLDNKYNKLWISQTHEWLTFSLLILRHQEITSVTKHWFCLAH